MPLEARSQGVGRVDCLVKDNLLPTFLLTLNEC